MRTCRLATLRGAGLHTPGSRPTDAPRLGDQAEFFVFQNAGRAEILGLVVALSGAIPLALVAAERLAGLVGPRTGHRVHETIVAVGVALTMLPALRPVEAVPGIALVFAALVLGAGVAVLYARLGPVRLFFTLLAPGVIVFPGLFVAASPVTPLLAQHGQVPEGKPYHVYKNRSGQGDSGVVIRRHGTVPDQPHLARRGGGFADIGDPVAGAIRQPERPGPADLRGVLVF